MFWKKRAKLKKTRITWGLKKGQNVQLSQGKQGAREECQIPMFRCHIHNF